MLPGINKPTFRQNELSFALRLANDIGVKRFSTGFVSGIAVVVKKKILALAIVRFRQSRLLIIICLS